MQLPTQAKPISVAEIATQRIALWSGLEMALSETPLKWSDQSVPYLQFVSLDMKTESGQIFRWLSQLNDGSDFQGLYLVEINEQPVNPPPDPQSIFRYSIPDLPIGEAHIEAVRYTPHGHVVEAQISVHGSRITLCAGEVHEREGGHLEIVELDESILVQLDGKRPLLKP